MKRLWDESDSLNSDNRCSCNCVCGGKQKLSKSLEYERLIKFLMGLNEAYAPTRSSILMIKPLPNLNHAHILMIKPLPNLNHAHSLLLQDENQRESYVNAHIPTGSPSFMVRKQGVRNQGYADAYGYTANQAYVTQKPQSQIQGNWDNKSSTRFPSKITNFFCTHCKKTNHVKDNWYRLIGFPSNFKFTNSKAKKFLPTIKSNAASAKEPEGVNYNPNMRGIIGHNPNSSGHFLTTKEYSHVVQYYRGNKGRESSVSVIPSDATMSGNANASNGITYSHAFTCLATLNSSSWIIDSGASEHMCFNPKVFMFLTPLPSPIILPNLTKVNITHRGNISIFADVVIQNVLYVPSFRYNLLSIDKFVKQFQSTLIFTPIGCLLQVSFMKRDQVFGEAKNGLFLLQPDSSSNKGYFRSHQDVLGSDVSSKSYSVLISVKSKSDVMLWHKRLGHLPFHAMKNISSFNFHSISECSCDVCPLARQSRLSFPISHSNPRGFSSSSTLTFGDLIKTLLTMVSSIFLLLF
ncbi:hypothetical protein KY289_021612 [Solanum tuberosum]|nr:hypothetical protein KY284_021394 [Solanum tuberosum]KAH0683860.1 hypothetical protein KY289_021612 [Solanum tuberosum]